VEPARRTYGVIGRHACEILTHRRSTQRCQPMHRHDNGALMEAIAVLDNECRRNA